MNQFEIGTIYSRQTDIHARFGGQAQGRISTPTGVPFIFLFTGETGEQYGYKDGWGKDGVFLYTGEGQIGDMQFRGGNKAIRDHVANGKDLLLFQSIGKGKGYRYLGQCVCTSWETGEKQDLKREPRKIILFHLVQPNGDSFDETEAAGKLVGLTLDQLRKRALEASSSAPERTIKEGRRIYYERSAVVREYVLARANGVCESCKQPAPFTRIDGRPYLEPHHTHRLSDGGLDDPRLVAGVCPNCHRRIHHGKDGNDINKALLDHLSRLEKR
jgi:5-methylcytosine-specific restriction protein A